MLQRGCVDKRAERSKIHASNTHVVEMCDDL